MSTGDLVVRLRNLAGEGEWCSPLAQEAADEIEKLLALLEEALNELPDDPGDDGLDDDGNERLYPSHESLIGRIQIALGYPHE